MSKTPCRNAVVWHRTPKLASKSASTSSSLVIRRQTRSSVKQTVSADFHLDDSKEESSSSEEELELNNEVFHIDKDVIVQVERLSLTAVKKRQKPPGIVLTPPSSPPKRVKTVGVPTAVEPSVSKVATRASSPSKKAKTVGVSTPIPNVVPFNEAKISLSSTSLAELYFEQISSKKLLFAKSKTGKRGLKYKTRAKATDREAKLLAKPDKMAPLNWEKFLDCLDKPSEVEQRLIDSRITQLESQFREWLRLFSTGSNLLFYGFGSKYNLLESFRTEMLADFTQVVIRGYQPGFSLKNFIDTLAKGLKVELNATSGRQKSAQLDQLEAIREKIINLDQDIFIVIHNIDGEQLRTEPVQQALAYLACGTEDNLHFVASIDHINAPLMWNQTKLSQLRWLWIHSTTFVPYKEELTQGHSEFLTLGGGLGSGGHSVASLRSIWASLTQNARAIFVILSKNLVKYGKTRGYSGMAFWELYRSCRDEFLVSSEAALHSQLVEFKDHRLLQTKRGQDGTEFLLITLDVEILKEFLTEEGFEEFDKAAEEEIEAEPSGSGAIEPTEQFGLEDSDSDG